MTTYSIYFENNYGSTQNYAFFCQEPQVSSNTGAPTVYSNVFLSQSVANDGNWSIDITKTYYAWCGTAPQQLQPGVKVSNGNGKLVTLGTTTAPGSTWTMYNNQGSPAFKDQQQWTANPGSYEIDTGIDFQPANNFCIGLGGVDGAGRMKPLASFDAPRNAKVNIAPVTKFYIGAFDSSAGTVIKTSTVSNQCANIDFSNNPGIFGAVVKQKSTGEFTVTYTNQTAFARQVSIAQGLSWKESELKRYIKLIQDILNDDDEESDVGADPVHYKCSLTWQSNPSNSDKRAVSDALIANMAGYSYESGDFGGSQLTANFSHPLPSTLDQARLDWSSAVFNLPMSLKQFTVDPRVDPAGTFAAEQEEVATTGSGQDSIEAKKQRARQLLAAQGLTGFALNGIHN